MTTQNKIPILISLSILISLLISCADSTDYYFDYEDDRHTQTSIIEILSNNYIPLPERALTVSPDSTVYAQYALPTERYGHGILGDRIEAQQLVVAFNSQIYEYTLEADYVYEDIRPRLYDIDNDGTLEIITIRTHIRHGAGIAIYKLDNQQLTEYARVAEIGTPYRWLNIAAIADLDHNGSVEIVWVETPHIGGMLKVATISPGTLIGSSIDGQYSNHSSGDRNLCLSTMTDHNTLKVLYVPNQNRTAIHGFKLVADTLVRVDIIEQMVDFAQPLHTQVELENMINDAVNCIY